MNPCPLPTRRAFSLIELLVVILIIALIITIAIPSLSGARNASRAAGSRALLNNITQAASQFERDERRMPGYFSVSAMGHAENADRGFAALQNVILDLAGGIVSTNGCQVPPGYGTPYPGDPNSTLVLVGPQNDCAQQVWVDVAYIGAAHDSNKMYWVPDQKNFVRQDVPAQHAGLPQHGRLPSVVDSFGNPVLAWVLDETVVGPITRWQQFSGVASPAPGASGDRARFYWNSNSAHLRATGLGTRHRDQTTDNMRDGSMIGSTAFGGTRPSASDPRLGRSLAAILGHPSYPYHAPGAGAGAPPEVPAAPRGSFIVHSAGADGIYFSRADRGARQFDLPEKGQPLRTTSFIDYRLNFVSQRNGTLPDDGYVDRDGRPTNIDIVDRFDDLLAVGGN